MSFLADIFEGEVDKHPSRSCVILEDGRTFSYQQVNDISTRIGKELACAIETVEGTSDGSERAEGACVDTPLVAVMMTRGIGIVSSILGILKAGAAYVPVDPSFPPDRQTHIFVHSNCKILITDEESLQLALSLGVVVPPTVVIDCSSPFTADNKLSDTLILRSLYLPSFRLVNKNTILAKARRKVYDREDGGLAYVLYTSGSTGKPKGVMLKQPGVVNIVEWFAEELQVTCESRVLGLTTFCFDISVLEMFLPLFRGAALVMVNQSSQRDPFQLLDVIRDTGVTVVQATPTTFEMLFATGWTGDKAIDFLVGGEAFRPSLVGLTEHCRSLRNVYGPTESTIWSSCFKLPPLASLLQLSNGVPVIPIGLPISQTVFYIATEEGGAPQQVPKGGEGELWIGGVGVAQGYLHAPDLTKEKFFRNPFGPGSVYRTGDIVSRIEGGDGDYVFLRRMDDQVKIDGFRIELAEIETVFATHDLLDKAVAVVREGKLVVYFKSIGGLQLSAPQLTAVHHFAARSLTHYMMPKSIVQVSAYPETANGKLDRKALRDPVEGEHCDAFLVSEHDTHTHNGNGNDNSGGDVGSLPSPQRSPLLQSLEVDLYNGDPTLDAKERGDRGDNKKNPSTPHRGLALAKHICDTVEKLRGRRPTYGSSFAAIGVDSLGAIMFIKYLSDSLGGVRIEPSRIYAPGVTIRSFAEQLLARLDVENPAALERIGIMPCEPEDILSSMEGGGMILLFPSRVDANGNYFDPESPSGYSEEEGEEKLYWGAEEVQRMENSFEDILSSNRAFIEGVRGVFTFFVLYDHFHNPKDNIAAAFSADTYLFIMVSGFTTALQLREPPRFARVKAGPRSSSSISDFDDAPEEDILGGGLGGLRRADSGDSQKLYSAMTPKRNGGLFRVLKGEGDSEGLKLLPRGGFKILPFVLSRCVGLLPILWIALLLNWFPWWRDNRGTTPLNVKVGCSALYVVGMQSWWRPACHNYGPNNVLYASILLNCFVIYSLGRLLIVTVQDHLMKWASKELSPVTLKPPRRILRKRTWKQWVGDKVIALTFNRMDMPTMLFMLCVWLVLGVGLFTLMLFFTFAKNALTFIPYFLVGVMAAAVLESIHTAFWDWGRNRENAENDSFNRVINFMHHVYNYSESEGCWPWVHDSWLLSHFYVSSLHTDVNDHIDHNSPITAAYSPLRVISEGAEQGGGSLDVSHSEKVSPSGQNADTHIERSLFFIFCCNFWRFLPDLCSIGIGFLMSTIGALDRQDVKFITWFITIPTAFLILIIVSMLQKGSARYNLSRFFLECSPLTTLGYTSYAMYLFQRIAFNFYLPLFYFWYERGVFDINVGDPDRWFERLPNGDKFLSVVCLTFICYIVHKYFQDRLVTYWYAKLMSRM